MRIIVSSIILLCLFAAGAVAEVISEDTIWQGEVILHEDVLIAQGVTVTVRPGTVVRMQAAESTKIDPEYISHRSEILVRGVLEALGSQEAPIHFLRENQAKEWAGILVDGGTLQMTFSTIEGADVGVYLLKGSFAGKGLLLHKNRYGLIAQGTDAQGVLTESRVEKNDYGLLQLDGGRVTVTGGSVAGNEKEDLFSGTARSAHVSLGSYTEKERPISRIYKNETIQGETIWSGLVRIEGQVRVAAEARLILLPGTVVAVSRTDTNGDGIGENGLLVQGTLWAKGTAKEPIFFRSAEVHRQMGDWDSINILGSDISRNLIEYVQVEDAYRGLHLHFSNVAITNTIFKNNYRGIQFQESLVEIRNSQFYHNRSGLQARDSQLELRDNLIAANINGANLFRMNLQARGNTIADNLWDGLRIREGTANVEGNSILSNRFGLVVADAVFGAFHENLVAGNSETGVILRNNDHISFEKNSVAANALNGMTIFDSRVVVRGNLVSENGVRGIGIRSFVGRIEGNNFVDNGSYAIGLDGGDDVDARGNWWHGADLQEKIYDRSDEPQLGRVDTSAVLDQPVTVDWPVAEIAVDLSWSGALRVAGTVRVAQNHVLRIEPGTKVLFAHGAGMDIAGKMRAEGTADQRILFTSEGAGGPKSWEEIGLNYAVGSVFRNCDFEHAKWPIHSHFSNLQLDRCRFRHNDGGMRFRSGPVLITNSIFQDNRIGIRSFQGTGVFQGNVFANNEIGIFVREGGGGLTIEKNNFQRNERYNIRLGDFNAEDVNARSNWWDGADIVETVFDGHNEEYIGMVLYEPILAQPMKPVLEKWQ